MYTNSKTQENSFGEREKEWCELGKAPLPSPRTLFKVGSDLSSTMQWVQDRVEALLLNKASSGSQ